MSVGLYYLFIFNYLHFGVVLPAGDYAVGFQKKSLICTLLHPHCSVPRGHAPAPYLGSVIPLKRMDKDGMKCLEKGLSKIVKKETQQSMMMLL